MDDDEERPALVLTVGVEQVDRVARMRTVGNAEFGAPGPRTTVGGGVPLPAGNDLGMLGDPGAIVVFSLEIDRAQAQTSSSASALAGTRTGRSRNAGT